MIRGIHHLALHTRDIERMIAFYRDVIGFEVVSRIEWADNPAIDEVIGISGSAAKQAMLKASNCYLELFEFSQPLAKDTGYSQPHNVGYTHLCLDVTDIEIEYTRLQALGVLFSAQPGDFGDIKAVYGRDPEGNIIEIQELTAEHEFALRRLHN